MSDGPKAAVDSPRGGALFRCRDWLTSLAPEEHARPPLRSIISGLSVPLSEVTEAPPASRAREGGGIRPGSYWVWRGHRVWPSPTHREVSWVRRVSSCGRLARALLLRGILRRTAGSGGLGGLGGCPAAGAWHGPSFSGGFFGGQRGEGGRRVSSCGRLARALLPLGILRSPAVLLLLRGEGGRQR
ncbi:hypothetical protein NDU88_000017 [Pleurodeles waltl]|uniref:Uncharacterized protein n=1 Tax=Pleurodeles waltl TaxID=8319 RepID=A0AAV7LZ11_PLEWA|nr:hypothetical protein NDU88_000017 [Pleurodeles waltl]